MPRGDYGRVDNGGASCGLDELQDALDGDTESVTRDAVFEPAQVGCADGVRAYRVSGREDLLPRREVDRQGVPYGEYHSYGNDHARRVFPSDDCVTATYTFYASTE